MKAAAYFVILLELLAMELQAGFLIYPRILESRSDDGTLLLHINEGLILRLQKSSILADDLFISTKAIDIDTFIRGMLTNQLRINPVIDAQRSQNRTPLHEVVNVRERTDSSGKSDEMTTSLQSNDYTSPTYDDGEEDESAEAQECGSDVSSETDGNTRTPERGSTNETFTVETCFVTSQNYTNAFKSLSDLIMYLATMLNAVGLRFLDMTEPMITFQLNHVMTNLNDEVLSWKNSQVDINATLENMKSLAMTGVFNRCDIAVLMTTEDLVYFEDEEIGSDADGVAFTGGVCGDEKVAAVEDTPHTYNGVHRLAHEVAHILGASHDNASALETFPGYPGSESCPWLHGYLMSYCEGRRNRYTLSNCSRNQVRFIYRTLGKECTDVSEEACYTSDFYPGMNITRREFCKLMHPGEPTAKPEHKRSSRHEQCRIKCCWKDEDFGGVCQVHYMSEGLKCGPSKTCKRGVCARHQWNNSIRRSVQTQHTNLIPSNKAF
uniref:Peptidase M12B domain-containing protein n=1 Tax=Amblyomma maculatum TaxID=34609 RepID=G3MPR2_AMBMU